MSKFKNVFDFMESVPEAQNHEEIYRQTGAKGGRSDIDLNAWELSTTGIGEKNLLSEVATADKFRRPDMLFGFKLNSTSLAKHRLSGRWNGDLSSTKVYDETLLMEHTIELKPMGRRVACSGRPGLEVLNNAPLCKKMKMAVAGIQPASLTGIPMTFVCEKPARKPDMSHMFLKGYLMLMAYNLAVISDVYSYRYNYTTAELVAGVSPDSKLNLLMMEDIVIDVAHFSPNEVALLVEMSCEFPTRRYRPANIYNNIKMSKDNVTFISDDINYQLPQNMEYGSPDMKWMNLLNIAIKFHALDDLREVIRDFRGVPGMLRDVSQWGNQTCFTVSYPRSCSISTAVDSLDAQFPVVLRNSGYYATSKCVVVDLLLSNMLRMSCYNLIEQSGAYNFIEESGYFVNLGCPFDGTLNDPFFVLNLLNYGLGSDIQEDNSLLQEWYGIKNCIMPVSFGGKLKDMVVKMAHRIRSGETSFLRPLLLHSLPYSASRNTTWAVVHGLRNWAVVHELRNFDFESTQRLNGILKQYQMIKAYAWGDGSYLTLEESKFIPLVLGEYDIDIKHMLDTELNPQADELKLGRRAFYSSALPWTSCTVVFNSDGVEKMVVDGHTRDVKVSESLGVAAQAATLGASAVRTAAVRGLSKANVARLVDVSAQAAAHGVASCQAGGADGVQRLGTDAADTKEAGERTTGGVEKIVVDRAA
ncbi:hypothetical protein P3S68_023443 [Capsicum galapagoense]